MVKIVGATICCRLTEQKIARYQLIGFPPPRQGLGLHLTILPCRQVKQDLKVTELLLRTPLLGGRT